MTRLVYLFWVLLALALFVVMLMFVLANNQSSVLDLLVPGWELQAPLGVLALGCFAIGAVLGLISGLGISLVRRAAAPSRARALERSGG